MSQQSRTEAGGTLPPLHPLRRGILLRWRTCGVLLLAAAGPATAACPAWSGVPELTPVIPCDSRGTSQVAFNRLAWQQFIALNWAADLAAPGQPDTGVPASAFGTPLPTPVVWETFKEASEVFRPNGQPPLPWNARQAAPRAMLARIPGGKLKATSPLGVKALYDITKLGIAQASALRDIGEAGTNGSWLTAQPRMNNYLTLFEKRLNQDEYNYITQNSLYLARNQPAFATTQGLNMPDGSATFSSYGTVGAIEIKAAWIQLDDPALWPLFKTSKAIVSYPTRNGATVPKQVTVGLVALHIIRKTPNAQQFVWSTFEHVRNAPGKNELSQPPQPWYTYYNPACNPATDYYKCNPNQAPQSCQGAPAGCKPDPYDAPVQVVRNTPISSAPTNDIAGLNKQVWDAIAAANPDSVFLNYQLVNVLWPNNNSPIAPDSPVPLTAGDPQPPAAQQPVANVVLETYHQDKHCLSCHTYAPVAGANATLASDYSFLYANASNPALVRHLRRGAATRLPGK